MNRNKRYQYESESDSEEEEEEEEVEDIINSSDEESENEDHNEDETSSEEEVTPNHRYIPKRNGSSNKKMMNNINNNSNNFKSSKKEQDNTERIHKHLLIDSLNENATQQCEKIMKQYENEEAELVLSPNWTCEKALSPLSGFTLVVDSKRTPVKKIQFNPDKMFTGTIAIKINDFKFKNDKSNITKEKLILNKDKIITQLNTHIIGDNVVSNLPSIECMNEKDFKYDKKDWQHCLSTSNSSYVSICNSIEKKNGLFKNDYWIIVKDTNTNISNDAYNIIEDALNDQESDESNSVKKYNPKVNWKNLFEENQSMKYLKELSNRNRSKILYSITQALDLDVDLNTKNTIQDIYSINKNKKNINNNLILNPDIETLTNHVSIVGDKAFYYSGTTSTNSIRNGILFNENPLSGTTILKGKNISTINPYGCGWKVQNQDEKSLLNENTFPVTTGRIRSYKSVSKDEIENIVSNIDTQYYISNGSNNINNNGNKFNSRLSLNIYRQRDSKFVEKQKETGYDPSWGEVHLVPLYTKINHN